MLEWMTVNGGYGDGRLPFVVSLVDVLVHELAMQPPVRIVEHGLTDQEEYHPFK